MGKRLLRFLAICTVAYVPWSLCAQDSTSAEGDNQPEVSDAVHYDISAPLRDMPSAPEAPFYRRMPLGLVPRGSSANAATLMEMDPVVQSSATRLVATTPGLNFAGIGNGDYGFVPRSAPPDTEGAVGATQYVQWVNTSFAVFNKSTGARILGPVAGKTLWSGFGGGCQNNNDGDPVVQYDQMANRWVFTQFSVSTTPFLQCVAVSTTSDATGSYVRYAFTQPNFNDYAKLGVWPDGYYLSFNMFNGNNFVGGRACVLDRLAMISGLAAKQICFQLSNLFGGLLPSDLDGATPPPAGSPNFFVAFGNNSASLDIWKFHANFVTPASSTLVHTNIAAPAFAAACGGGGTCIPQPGTTQQLDSLADRLMYRLAYRNFVSHESLVVNHSVTVGTHVGVRWYEIRSPNTTPVVFQSGTYSPDTNSRWMGSIAMDKVGNIALGYSVSSASLHPAIRYTGRAPTDPLGTLQAENTILNGAGSQIAGLSRWGDYSAMTIDPVDDCTFFYTNEYLKTNGSFNWSTRIASFKFPSCTNGPSVLTTIKVTPSSASVQTGNKQQFTAKGYDQFGQLLSSQPTFTWTVSGGGAISTTGLFTAGSTTGGPFTVTATSGAVKGTASVTVTNLPDFSLSVSPSSVTVTRPNSATYTVTITRLRGFTGSVTLSLSGQPSSVTVLFTPNPATTTSTLKVTPATSTPIGTFKITVRGQGGSFVHFAVTTLIVN
jgi:hypothetical protein